MLGGVSYIVSSRVLESLCLLFFDSCGDQRVEKDYEIYLVSSYS